MNLEDFAKINKIKGYFKPQIVGIKIIDSEPSNWVCEKFRKDLELFSSLGDYREVSRVRIYGDCFVTVQLKDNSTPLIYYFACGFDETEATISRFEEISEGFGIPIDHADPSLL